MQTRNRMAIGDMRALGIRNSIRLKYPGDQNP